MKAQPPAKSTPFWVEPPPGKISSSAWRRSFATIPAELIDRYRYYRDNGKTPWNTYLIPPSTFAAYGVRYLQKLRFDNSLASLRLWGFALTESERLYRARQSGKKVVALMGDLGPLAPLVYSFPNVVAFYPECHWWTPFLTESNDLFDVAARKGIGEDCCFVRAALGAFLKRCYFPGPDLCVASVGATCDDMAAVIQGAWGMKYPFFWFEIPHRPVMIPPLIKGGSGDQSNTILSPPYQGGAGGDLQNLLVSQFQTLIPRLEEISGHAFSAEALRHTLAKVNRFRRSVEKTRRYAYRSYGASLPALEMMDLEFMGMAFYADLDEALDIARHLERTARKRFQQKQFVTATDAYRLFWVTPPADPILLNHAEELGGQVVGSEYLINQIRKPLREDLPPLEALTEGILAMSLIGTSGQRANIVVKEAKQAKAEGVIISSIFAGSHCASENRIIAEEVRRRLNLPVLVFDVVGPGKERQQGQTLSRMQAFMEVLQARRGRKAVENREPGEGNREQ
jgi:hypothetical protein